MSNFPVSRRPQQARPATSLHRSGTADPGEREKNSITVGYLLIYPHFVKEKKPDRHLLTAGCDPRISCVQSPSQPAFPEGLSLKLFHTFPAPFGRLRHFLLFRNTRFIIKTPVFYFREKAFFRQFSFQILYSFFNLIVSDNNFHPFFTSYGIKTKKASHVVKRKMPFLPSYTPPSAQTDLYRPAWLSTGVGR
jgi:hypothetical protein